MEDTLKLILEKLNNLEQGQRRIESRLDGIEDKLDGLQGEFETSIQDLATHIDCRLNKIDVELAVVKHKINRTDDDVIGIKTRLEIVK